MSKVYSVNMLIALFTDFKEDGFHTLSESEVLEALQSLNAAEHTLAVDGYADSVAERVDQSKWLANSHT